MTTFTFDFPLEAQRLGNITLSVPADREAATGAALAALGVVAHVDPQV